MVRLMRKYHKWLMCFVGLQFLIWSITGLYMVSVDIHHIHGESLTKHQEQTLNLQDATYPIGSLIGAYPNASGISLVPLMDSQVYRFRNGEKKRVIVDAKTGERWPEIDHALAERIARYYYAESHDIDSMRLISSVAEMPAELAPRHLPVWQVTFDSLTSPTLYVSQQTGAIVTKRHTFWRVFDWMWRFHIMDYDDGENISNWFLLVFALLGLLAALAGAVLTFYRVFRPNSGEAV